MLRICSPGTAGGRDCNNVWGTSQHEFGQDHARTANFDVLYTGRTDGTQPDVQVYDPNRKIWLSSFKLVAAPSGWCYAFWNNISVLNVVAQQYRVVAYGETAYFQVAGQAVPKFISHGILVDGNVPAGCVCRSGQKLTVYSIWDLPAYYVSDIPGTENTTVMFDMATPEGNFTYSKTQKSASGGQSYAVDIIAKQGAYTLLRSYLQGGTYHS